jgi:hypothetical protein
MALEIDYTRGVTHKPSALGLRVYMYKDDPGKYYLADGSTATREQAASAGFDVGSLATQKDKKEKLQTARENVEREFEQEKEDLDILPLKMSRKGVWFTVLDEGGNPLHDKGKTREEAVTFAREYLSQREAEPVSE